MKSWKLITKQWGKMINSMNAITYYSISNWNRKMKNRQNRTKLSIRPGIRIQIIASKIKRENGKQDLHIPNCYEPRERKWETE